MSGRNEGLPRIVKVGRVQQRRRDIPGTLVARRSLRRQIEQPATPLDEFGTAINVENIRPARHVSNQIFGVSRIVADHDAAGHDGALVSDDELVDRHQARRGSAVDFGPDPFQCRRPIAAKPFIVGLIDIDGRIGVARRAAILFILANMASSVYGFPGGR